jgi:Mrp family chromosome partitioning ATPase
VPPVPGPTAISFQPLPLTYLPPRERFASDLVAYHQPEHPVSQQYRSLLAALLAQAPSIPLQVLMFTAPIPLPGTTTVLLNLALTCARQGRERIAVIDANIERPTVAQRLGLPSCPGWCEVLAGTVPLDQALQETGQDRLQALPAGQTTGESRFASETIRAVFRQLRGQFGLVLVDAPCWDSRPDLLALGAACDAVYLVLEPGGSDLPEVKQLCHSLPRQGIPLRGCILMQS